MRFDRIFCNEIAASAPTGTGCCGSKLRRALPLPNPTDNSFVAMKPGPEAAQRHLQQHGQRAVYPGEHPPTCCTSEVPAAWSSSTSGIPSSRSSTTSRAEDGGLTDNDKSILATTIRTCCSQPTGSRSTTPAAVGPAPNTVRCPTIAAGNSLRTLFRDRQNIVWIGTDSGLAKLDLKTQKIISVRAITTGKGPNAKSSSTTCSEPPTTACGSPRTKASCGTTARDATQDTRVTWPDNRQGFRTRHLGQDGITRCRARPFRTRRALEPNFSLKNTSTTPSPTS